MIIILYIVLVLAVPVVLIGSIVVLFKRLAKTQEDVRVLKQIIYKSTTQSSNQAPVQTNTQPTVQSVVQGQPAQPFQPAENIPHVQAPFPSQSLPSQNSHDRSLSEEASGRWLGKLGMLAIVLGVSFFIKDAFANNWIGPGGRVLVGILGGVILLVIGQLVRQKYKNYSDVLVGGSYGVFYLTTFGAFYFYHLISAPVAYGFFVGITALSVIMSIIDKSSLLAHIGVFFGFLAPILLTGLSVKDASMLAQLLSYVLIIDIGVAIIAYVYHWKSLSFLAFVGTMFSYIVAVDLYLNESMRSVAFLFLTLYFLVFLFVAIAHHLVRKEKTVQSDILLISLNALQYGVFGAGLIKLMAPGYLGFFCVAVGIIYFIVAIVSWKTCKDDVLLNLYLPGVVIAFLTVSIPAQLDGKGVLIGWLVEALVLVWVSHKTQIKNMLYVGGGVFVAALIKYIVEFEGSNNIFYRIGSYDFVMTKITDYNFLFNTRMMYALIITIVGSFVTWGIYRGFKKWDDKSFKVLAGIWFVVINIFFLVSIVGEVSTAYRVMAHNDAVDISEKSYNEASYEGAVDMYGEVIQNKEEYIKRERMYQFYNEAYYKSYNDRSNQLATITSIIMALYASLLLVAGFVKNSRFVRICGLVLIFITAIYIFVSIWELGSVYRITTAIIFGIIALLGSFAYARFTKKEDAKQISL